MDKLKKSSAAELEYVKCSLCSSDCAEVHMKVNGFTIVKCKNCGLIYVNPRLKPAQLEKIYDGKTYFNNPSFKSPKYTFFGYENYLLEKKDIMDTFERRLDTIEKYKKPGTLLDVGCALGFFLEAASKRGWKAQGVEISSAAADYAKKHQQCRVFNGTLEEANYKSKSFDAITLFDVIEHLQDPKKTILKIKSLLKPKGIIAVTTPDAGSLPARMLGRRWEEVRRVREHIYFFTGKTLKKLLENAGFKVLKKESAGRYFSLKYALRRLNMLSPALSHISIRLAKILGIENMRVYADPRYKITMYARKD